jgi:GDPmannose 4,6-dehydratase
LAELLLDRGYEVHGWRDRLTLHYGDVADSSSLLRILLGVRPEEIYHLAAQSHVGISFDIPDYTHDVTGLGTTRLLDALRVSGLRARLFNASSSEMFGNAPSSPQNESTPLNPRSPYACAKTYAFNITRTYRDSYGVFAANGIMFNHESERRGENFVTRKITLSLAKVLAGRQDCLVLGNLDARRDWGYAPEYVEGMWRALQADAADDFVFATGVSTSVRDFLERCLTLLGIDYEREGAGSEECYVDRRSGRILVRVDGRYVRPTEIRSLVGDAAKARAVLGWHPRTDVAALARRMLQADCAAMGVPGPRE